MKRVISSHNPDIQLRQTESASMGSLRSRQGEHSFDLCVVRTINDLETWRDEWNELVAKNPEPVSAFLWNQAWYRAHQELIDEMLVFVAFRNGAVSAILPAYAQENEIRLASDEFALCQDLICEDMTSAKLAIDSIISWLGSEMPGFQIRWENLAADGVVSRVFSEDEESFGGFALYTGESDSRPIIELSDGYAEYVRDLPEAMNQELRSALRVIDRDLPRAHIEIKRGYNIRVDALSDLLQFVEKHGQTCGTPFYFDPCTLAFLGELAKCEELGLQMARLVDQGDTFSADIGLAYKNAYFPLLYAYDPQYIEVKPYESLFLSRINDWIARHDTQKVIFPCRDENLALRLSGDQSQEMHSLTLMDSPGVDRTTSSHRIGEARDNDATAPILAR